MTPTTIDEVLYVSAHLNETKRDVIPAMWHVHITLPCGERVRVVAEEKPDAIGWATAIFYDAEWSAEALLSAAEQAVTRDA